MKDQVRFLSCLGITNQNLSTSDVEPMSGFLRRARCHGRRRAHGESSCDGFGGRSAEAGDSFRIAIGDRSPILCGQPLAGVGRSLNL